MSVALHISWLIHHMIAISGALVLNYDISRDFFHFIKILIFWVVGRVKGQKMVQNEKKLCLSRSISQESYIIWFSFMVHICKMVLSTGIFFHFSKILIFRVIRGVKVQKIVRNDKKFSLSRSISQETYIIWSSFVLCKCKMIISSGLFSFFHDFDFSGC